jgi:acyl dehydratase
MSTEIYERLKALTGQEGPPVAGPDEVCKQMIRHWCEAVEDANPLYTDEEYAKTTRYGRIISPPAMVQTWSYAPVWPDGQEMRYRHPEKRSTQDQVGPVERAFLLLGEAGFLGAVDISSTLDFFRPLFPGDQVIVKSQLVNVTEEKKTSIGNGHFVTFAWIYNNQNSEIVCKQTMTIFQFRSTGK